MDGPFIPEGEPVKKGVSTDGTKHWKEYADGSRIQTDPDGTNHYAYPDNAPHGIKQYSAFCPPIPALSSPPPHSKLILSPRYHPLGPTLPAHSLCTT